jgi:hypothetical protein
LTCLPSNSGLIFFGISLSSCFDDTDTVLPSRVRCPCRAAHPHVTFVTC